MKNINWIILLILIIYLIYIFIFKYIYNSDMNGNTYIITVLEMDVNNKKIEKQIKVIKIDKNIENFHVKQNIDYYVITMFSPDRLANIETQIKKMKDTGIDMNMNYVDAVVGKDIDIDDLISKNMLTSNIYENKDSNFTHVFEKRKNEVGCYMSHLKIYDMIKNKGNDDGYSIIFEDDFQINDDFSNILEQTLLKLDGYDFDMLFLGMIGNLGDNIMDNIYYTTIGSYCCHAYLVNNKKIGKIISAMKYIDTIVDGTIFIKGHNKELTVLRISPNIAEQGGFGTTIR